jgi:sugar lactone lactonase YvrE
MQSSSIVSPVLAGHTNGLDVYAYQVSNRVGESPSWHPGQGVLYWIDVRAQELLRLNPQTDEITRWTLPDVCLARFGLHCAMDFMHSTLQRLTLI